MGDGPRKDAEDNNTMTINSSNRTCVICGAKLYSNNPRTLTCSPECRAKHKARRDEAIYEALKADPERYERHLARFRERYGADADFRAWCIARAKALSEVRGKAARSRWANGERPQGKMAILRCPATEAEALRDFARRERLPPSEVVRRAVADFLDKQKK